MGAAWSRKRSSIRDVPGSGGATSRRPTVPRAWLPLEIYPISAGVKGGLAGSVAMAVLAAAYGLLSGNGIWYPMNLLVAGLFPAMATETASQIGTFNLHRFLVAVPIHLLISLLVGLLYGAMLPMAPRRPILLGGFVAPLLWSGLIHGSSRVRQSGDEPAHRLALVCALADWIRNCGGDRGCASGTNPHVAARAAARSHGHRSAGIMRTGTPAGGRERDEVRCLSSRSRAGGSHRAERRAAGPRKHP